MEEQIKLDYFYGNEADRFCFYRIPKVLFTKAYFAGLSTDAKVLYGLMLDMMSSSRANRWIDTENRVFIQFSIQRAMAYLGCGKAKAIKLFAELDTEKGIGLIERVNRGLGKSDIIYVKSFEVPQEAEENARITQMKKHQQDLTFGPVVQKLNDYNRESDDDEVVRKPNHFGMNYSCFRGKVVRKSNRFQNRTGTKIELPEVCFSNPINTDYNNTLKNTTEDYSVSPSVYSSQEDLQMADRRKDRKDALIHQLRSQIRYDDLMKLDYYQLHRELVDA